MYCFLQDGYFFILVNIAPIMVTAHTLVQSFTLLDGLAILKMLKLSRSLDHPTSEVLNMDTINPSAFSSSFPSPPFRPAVQFVVTVYTLRINPQLRIVNIIYWNFRIFYAISNLHRSDAR